MYGEGGGGVHVWNERKWKKTKILFSCLVFLNRRLPLGLHHTPRKQTFFFIRDANRAQDPAERSEDSSHVISFFIF